MTKLYRTLFVGTLVQQSFLSLGGTDDPYTTVDSPFCRDGCKRPTLRGTSLAGALVATLRRLDHVPPEISCSEEGRYPSVWRFFNSHPSDGGTTMAYRQHVAIDACTGAAITGALFNVETLPPSTCWPFLLEVDTSRYTNAATLARKALSHWVAGRCLLGRDVARGLGWMKLENLQEYTLATEQVDAWPCARESAHYPDYIKSQFQNIGLPVPAATDALPGWCEITGQVSAGLRQDGYGIDSLSIGGHASEELAAAWDERFLAPDGMLVEKARECFDPDHAVVTLEQNGKRVPYIPGSSLRGPLRHALARLLVARCGKEEGGKTVNELFGTDKQSAKLLICDALPVKDSPIQLAWLQHHAEDEFAGGAYSSSKFDRVAVMQGTFAWKMVLENASDNEKKMIEELLGLARTGQIGIGGGQWRGHGWLHWTIDKNDCCYNGETV
ncbi:MAG: hypothetical protein HQL58_11095 [Magnetococcales bacterium]|nr:hypothetical protein [Magnetococcales bacterium]